MIGNVDLPEDVDDDMDIYDALGLNTPTGPAAASAPMYDPLAAFMDDDDEPIEVGVFVQTSPVSDENVELLIATLARDLLDHERLSASLSGGRVDMDSLRIERDRDAYHLSLIVDMGGEDDEAEAVVQAIDRLVVHGDFKAHVDERSRVRC